MHSAFALGKPQWRFDTHRYVGQCRGHKVHRSRSIMLFSELEKAERESRYSHCEGAEWSFRGQRGDAEKESGDFASHHLW